MQKWVAEFNHGRESLKDDPHTTFGSIPPENKTLSKDSRPIYLK